MKKYFKTNIEYYRWFNKHAIKNNYKITKISITRKSYIAVEYYELDKVEEKGKR